MYNMYLPTKWESSVQTGQGKRKYTKNNNTQRNIYISIHVYGTYFIKFILEFIIYNYIGPKLKASPTNE